MINSFIKNIIKDLMKMDYNNEIWLPVKGFEKFYEVSNYGRVKSLARAVPHMFNITKYNETGKVEYDYIQNRKEKILNPQMDNMRILSCYFI